MTVVSEFVYYATGYSVLFLLGLKINGMKRLSPWLISATAIFAISLVYVFLRFDTLLVYKFKSPPQFHFIAYGAMMSIACFAIVKKLKGIKGVGLINFIGQNTIWIYLWHIPLIQFTKLLGWQWCIRYVCVYVVAVAICYVQVRIVDAVQSRYGIKALKYLKG